jgi:lipoate-protein ligase A
VGGEVVVDGRKLVGSAQVRHGGALLQHGSILLDGAQNMVRAVSRRPAAGKREITAREALGRPVAPEDVAAAVIAAWQAGDAPAAVPDALDSATDALCDYASPAWTWRR